LVTKYWYNRTPIVNTVLTVTRAHILLVMLMTMVLADSRRTLPSVESSYRHGTSGI
jgi:hypothetical protein